MPTSPAKTPTRKKRTTLAQRVEKLEREVRVLKAGFPSEFSRQISAFLDEERARVTDDMIYGRIKKELERMEVELYDRLTHHRVHVSIHHEVQEPPAKTP